jgi:hypothetical protein
MLNEVMVMTLLIAALVAGAANAAPADSCSVRWSQEARYSGYAYDHLVHLHNECGYPVTCDVSTSVNPKSYRLTVAAETNRTVRMWAGAPTRYFSANVACGAK